MSLVYQQILPPPEPPFISKELIEYLKKTYGSLGVSNPVSDLSQVNHKMGQLSVINHLERLHEEQAERSMRSGIPINVYTPRS